MDKIGISPVERQMIEILEQSEIELCKCFHIPIEILIGDAGVRTRVCSSDAQTRNPERPEAER